MSGLSYFEDGGQAEPTDVAVQVKPTAGKGRYGLPTVTTNIPATAGVLSAMEQLYQEKLAQQQGFMEAMKDAAAWWSGGIEGPSAGLSRRSKEREEESAGLFQLQSQIAQYKAAQEAQREFERRRASGELYGPLGTQTGAKAPTAASQMFGMPPDIRQALMNAKTQAEADKIYADYAKKKAEVEANPEFDVPKIPVVEWNDETKSWDRKVISPRTLRANPDRYMSEAAPAPTAPAPTAPAPTAPAPTAPAPTAPAPTAPAPTAPAPTAPAPTAPAPTAPAPTTGYRFENLTPEAKQRGRDFAQSMGLRGDFFDRPDAAEIFNTLPEEKRRSFFERLQGPQVPAAPEAPVAPTTAGKRPPKPTPETLERQAEVEKQVEITAKTEQLKTDKIERDKFVSESDPTRVSERKVRADRVAEMVKTDPTIVGVLTQPDVRSAIANVLQQGLSTPSGAISVKGLSEAIYQTLPSTMSTAKRREIAGYIANMELDYSQAMNGQGQISDGEREIIRAAAISIEDPAEVVYKKAKMMVARQETLQKLRQIYGSGTEFTRNFEQFRSDPRYQKIAADYEQRLKDITGEDIKFDRSKAGQKPSATPSGTTKSGIPWKIVK